MDSILRISDAASLGLHAMAYLSNFGHHGPVSTGEMAEGLEVSYNHLAKVMGRLLKAQLVTSKKGPKGGFSLTKPSKEISLKDIYEAVEGPLPRATCLLHRPVCAPGGCVLGSLLRDVHEQVAQKLSTTTLEEFRLPQALRSHG